MILDPLRECSVGQWSAAIRDDGRVVDALDGGVRLPTASVGKVFLLLAVAERIAGGELDPASTLAPQPDDVVADSGLLQWFANQHQTVADLAVLVGP